MNMKERVCADKKDLITECCSVAKEEASNFASLLNVEVWGLHPVHRPRQVHYDHCWLDADLAHSLPEKPKSSVSFVSFNISFLFTVCHFVFNNRWVLYPKQRPNLLKDKSRGLLFCGDGPCLIMIRIYN